MEDQSDKCILRLRILESTAAKSGIAIAGGQVAGVSVVMIWCDFLEGDGRFSLYT